MLFDQPGYSLHQRQCLTYIFACCISLTVEVVNYRYTAKPLQHQFQIEQTIHTERLEKLLKGKLRRHLMQSLRMPFTLLGNLFQRKQNKKNTFIIDVHVLKYHSSSNWYRFVQLCYRRIQHCLWRSKSVKKMVVPLFGAEYRHNNFILIF